MTGMTGRVCGSMGAKSVEGGVPCYWNHKFPTTAGACGECWLARQPTTILASGHATRVTRARQVPAKEHMKAESLHWRATHGWHGLQPWRPCQLGW